MALLILEDEDWEEIDNFACEEDDSDVEFEEFEI